MRSPLLALLATAALAVPALAQQPGMGRQGGRGMMMNPFLMAGPPAPSEFAARVGLDAAGQQRYAAAYQSYLADTKVNRDSVSKLRDAARSAFQGGNRDGARAMMQNARPLNEALRQRYGALEDSLKAMLSADQYQKYEAWKTERMQQEMEQMRNRMGSQRPGQSS